MKVEIVHVSRRPPWPPWAVWVVLLWAGLGVGTVWLSYHLNRPVQLCLIKNLTGIPCPTCGLTRGSLLFLDGHILQAWLYNPLLFSVLGIFTIITACRLVLGRSIHITFSKPERFIAWTVAVVLVAANWTYICFREVNY